MSPHVEKLRRSATGIATELAAIMSATALRFMGDPAVIAGQLAFLRAYEDSLLEMLAQADRGLRAQTGRSPGFGSEVVELAGEIAAQMTKEHRARVKSSNVEG